MKTVPCHCVRKWFRRIGGGFSKIQLHITLSYRGKLWQWEHLANDQVAFSGKNFILIVHNKFMIEQITSFYVTSLIFTDLVTY